MHIHTYGPFALPEVMPASTLTAGWEQAEALGRACCLSPGAYLSAHQRPPWASLSLLNVTYICTCTHMHMAGTEAALRMVRGCVSLCREGPLESG